MPAQATKQSKQKYAGGREGKVVAQQFHKDINVFLTHVAEGGDLDQLLSAIARAIPDMNGINLATAIHRVAKLSTKEGWHISNRGARSWQHLAFEDLLKTIRERIEGHSLLHQQDLAVLPLPDEIPVQCMSIVAWSCATLGIVNRSLFQSIALIARPRLDKFQPFEVTNLVWAFAKAQMAAPELLNAAMLQVAHRKAGEYRAQCLSVLLWSFATAGCFQPEVFADIARELIMHTETMRPMEISNTLWAFARTGCYHPQLFETLGNSVVKDCKLWLFRPHELSSTLWAYATAGVRHESIFALAEKLALKKRAELSPQNMANILWSYAKLKVSPKGDLCGKLLDISIGQLPCFKPEEITLLTWAAAQMCPKRSEFFGAVTLHCIMCIGDFPGRAMGSMIEALSNASTERPGAFAKLLSACRARLAELEPETLYNITHGLAQAMHNQSLADVIATSADVPEIVIHALLRTQEQPALHTCVRLLIGAGNLQSNAWHRVMQSQEVNVTSKSQASKEEHLLPVNLETLSTSAESGQQEDEEDASQYDWNADTVVFGPPPGLSLNDVTTDPICETLPPTRLASLTTNVNKDLQDMLASHVQNSRNRQLQLPLIPVTCISEAGPGGVPTELNVFQARSGPIGIGAQVVHLRQGVLQTRVVVRCVPGDLFVPAMIEPSPNILWPLAEIDTMDKSCSYVAFPHCHHGTLSEWATAKAAAGQPVSVAEAGHLLLGVLRGAEDLCAMIPSAIRAVQPTEIFIGSGGEPHVRVPVHGSSCWQDDSIKWMSPEEVVNQVRSENYTWEAISYRLGLLLLSLSRGSYVDPFPHQPREMVLADLLQKARGVTVPIESEFQGPFLVCCLLDACLRRTKRSAPPREAVVQTLGLLTSLNEPLTIGLGRRMTSAN